MISQFAAPARITVQPPGLDRTLIASSSCLVSVSSAGALQELRVGGLRGSVARKPYEYGESAHLT